MFYQPSTHQAQDEGFNQELLRGFCQQLSKSTFCINRIHPRLIETQQLSVQLQMQYDRAGVHRCHQQIAIQRCQPRVQLPLHPLVAHEHRPKLKRHNTHTHAVGAHVAAAVALLLNCACSIWVHAAAQEVASQSFGNWSTANLSEVRSNLAATSLPNQGLAIFAGGNSTSCD
jgi:hypothetical protein